MHRNIHLQPANGAISIKVAYSSTEGTCSAVITYRDDSFNPLSDDDIEVKLIKTKTDIISCEHEEFDNNQI